MAKKTAAALTAPPLDTPATRPGPTTAEVAALHGAAAPKAKTRGIAIKRVRFVGQVDVGAEFLEQIRETHKNYEMELLGAYLHIRNVRETEVTIVPMTFIRSMRATKAATE